MRDRKIVHAPTKIAGNQPISIGYDFSTVSWVSELAGSWAPPLLFERISSAETPHQKGASQLRRISEAVQAMTKPGQQLTLAPVLRWQPYPAQPGMQVNCGLKGCETAIHGLIAVAVGRPGDLSCRVRLTRPAPSNAAAVP